LKSISVVQRFPNRQAILQVYAVISFLISAWTIIAFLWKLSAWLLILNLGEIFTIFSYAMVVNLLESLAVLLCALTTPRFPRRFHRAGQRTCFRNHWFPDGIYSPSPGIRHGKRTQIVHRTYRGVGVDCHFVRVPAKVTMDALFAFCDFMDIGSYDGLPICSGSALCCPL
jgi:hypothetical protein